MCNEATCSYGFLPILVISFDNAQVFARRFGGKEVWHALSKIRQALHHLRLASSGTSSLQELTNAEMLDGLSQASRGKIRVGNLNDLI